MVVDARDYITGRSNNISKINSMNEYEMNFIKNKILRDNMSKENIKGDLSTNNEFMNLSMNEIFLNMMNLIPNLYKDYHKKYLEISLKMKSDDKFTSENIIIRETLMSMIFNNKNIIYLGIIIMITSFFLYVINL